MSKLPDEIHRIVSGETSPPPIATWLGFRLTSVGYGEAVIEFEAAARHANPMGALQSDGVHRSTRPAHVPAG